MDDEVQEPDRDGPQGVVARLHQLEDDGAGRGGMVADEAQDRGVEAVAVVVGRARRGAQEGPQRIDPGEAGQHLGQDVAPESLTSRQEGVEVCLHRRHDRQVAAARERRLEFGDPLLQTVVDVPVLVGLARQQGHEPAQVALGAHSASLRSPPGAPHTARRVRPATPGGCGTMAPRTLR